MNEAISIPGYRIQRLLGRGGMATVHLAIQECLEREVALKVMSPILNLDPTFSSRFIREARIVAQIRHTSIVLVHDVGEYQDHQYLSMEYLPGIDLKQRILKGQYGVQLAVQVCEALASALDVAHRKGFVHRDIKPENVLFREDGTPVLTDFGIARAIDAGGSITKASMLVGTPSYMSPEQVQGFELDGRSDLYSLGILFYELLTGAVPFRADSMIAAAMKQLNEPLPRLPAAYAQYQPFLDRLTAKDRGARFSTGAEVNAELRRLGQPQEPEGATQIRKLTPEEQALLERRVAARQLQSDSLHWLDQGGVLGGGVSFTGQINQLSQSMLVSVNFTYSGQTGIPQMSALSAPVKTVSLGKPPILAEQSHFNQPLDHSPRQVQEGQSSGRSKYVLPWVGVMAAGALAAVAAGFMLYRGQEVKTRALPIAQAPTAHPEAAVAPVAPVIPVVAPEAAPVSTTPVAVVAAPPTQTMGTTSAEASPATLPDIPTNAAAPSDSQAAERQRSELARTARKIAAEKARREAAARMEAQLEQQVQVQTLLGRAEDNLRAGRLAGSAEDSALKRYRQVLAINPQEPEALAGLNRVAELLLDEASKAVANHEYDTALASLDLAESIRSSNPRVAQVRDEIALLRSVELPQLTAGEVEQTPDQKRAGRLIAQAQSNLNRKPLTLSRVKAAATLYERAVKYTPDSAAPAQLRSQITAAYQSLAETYMANDEPRKARDVIEQARQHDWLSADIPQLEVLIQASAQPQ